MLEQKGRSSNPLATTSLADELAVLHEIFAAAARSQDLDRLAPAPRARLAPGRSRGSRAVRLEKSARQRSGCLPIYFVI